MPHPDLMNPDEAKERYIPEIDGSITFLNKELGLVKKDFESIAAEGDESIYNDYKFRSGIIMLYARWEGMVKSLWEICISYINATTQEGTKLNPSFHPLAFYSLSKSQAGTIKSLKMRIEELGSVKSHLSFVDSIYENFNFKKIDQKSISQSISSSNLNWKQFELFNSTLGIPMETYRPIGPPNITNWEEDINQLVEIRNIFAHGSLSESPIELDTSEKLIETVREVIERFKTEIQNIIENDLHQLGENLQITEADS
ncbi:MAE_28990/MAE_18760 family HEPN-like nuclease [Rothia nasimurium]|uniref:MAE_28990/MAE_18760 family HEPN-like nuclease n=1 Tax=Rothia nasimurium TaxID=85336 RepID=UPI001F285530|nr:MAE_28990/MAE_18760 family HEPN-like nuclease [Rothia nasimurium]